MRKVLIFLAAAVAGRSQEPLGVKAAVRLALRENRAVAAAEAGVQAAQSRVAQARSGQLPKVNYSETFSRGDNPVYVFSSLLTQHQFGESNFAIGALNQPDALNNFQSQLTFEQTLYDGGQTRHAVRAASFGREFSEEDARGVRMETIARAARAYWDAVLAGESLKTAEQAVRSAEADLKRAEDVRAAGLSTDVDVLSIRVHLADVTEQRIRRSAELEVARAALNDALGLPLDSLHTLTGELKPADLPDQAVEELERQAREQRPEARRTRLGIGLAQTQADGAHAALLPRVTFQTALEADRQRFVTRGGGNWLASVSLRWNLFNGFSDKERIAETAFAVRRSEAEAQRMDSAVRLEARRAYAAWRSAEQRIEVARAAVAEAQESLRITQNRYQAGMSNVTDLLRNEVAVLESSTRYLAAVHDQRMAAVMVELAAGRLTPDSEVLN
jgi:outer membrane protein